MAETQRYPSTEELDLERRRAEADAKDQGETEVYAPFAVEGNDVSGYVGVDPMYMNYANETEKPLRAEEGVFADLEAEVLDVSDEDKATTVQNAEAPKDVPPAPSTPARVAPQAVQVKTVETTPEEPTPAPVAPPKVHAKPAEKSDK